MTNQRKPSRPRQAPARRHPAEPPAVRATSGPNGLAGDRLPAEGRIRAVVENVSPAVDGGQFPIKRIPGDPIVVEADVFADGHDTVTAVVQFRAEGDPGWTEHPMEFLGNDRHRGRITAGPIGRAQYRVAAWTDPFETWRKDLAAKAAAGQDVSVDLEAGALMVEAAAARAGDDDAAALRIWAGRLREASLDIPRAAAGDDLLAGLMARHAERRFVATSRSFDVVIDPPDAVYSTWYELFPRSFAAEEGSHGTFADVEAQLPRVAAMGFDVLYLPPIHPIGRTNRKGPNNSEESGPDDPGSPWAIGAAEGGHTAVHPELGTLEDFDRLVAAARVRGIQIALDIAFQCTPDHPWVREHPEWFRHRPDGTIRYAENPPKKYQDIYPIDFETEDWRGLWSALRDVVLFWAARGVRIFRVDNPHTKAFAFWEWMIADVKRRHPDAIFLSEAFTRPRVMERLAKIGFTQSYTYFTWRTAKWELTDYLTELTQSAVAEYMRPNLWPNTPDILPEQLQYGGRPAFVQRLVLAATLGASYGIYGPAFELTEHEPVAHGREEYRNSEKYEIRRWDLSRADSLEELIARVNRIRREHPALHNNRSLRFHGVDNDALIAYSKHDEATGDVVLVLVNLDPDRTHAGTTSLDLAALGLDPDQTYQAHDLLTEARFWWHGPHNYVELNPHVVPAHILHVRPRTHTESDFEYFA